MSRRLAFLLALVLALTSSTALLAGVAHAEGLRLAQDSEDSGEEADQGTEGGEEGGTGEETGSDGAGEEDEQSGESDPGAEVGADQGEDTEGEAAAEEGPVWTYQMSKIAIVLLVLMAVAIYGAYWRFVLVRQRTGT